MNAAKHKAEAERLIERAHEARMHAEEEVGDRMMIEAQVHATLATIPEHAELTAEIGVAPVRIGDRVIKVAERPGRGEALVIVTDRIGTVTDWAGYMGGDVGQSLAHVDWDGSEVGGEVVQVSQLRVVVSGA